MRNIYYDISAAAIYLVLLIIACIRGGISNKKERYYFIIVIVSLITAIFDIFCVHLDNVSSNHLDIRWFVTAGYLLFHTLTTPAYVLYIISQADRLFKLRQKKVLTIVCCVPAAVILVLLIVSRFTDCMFYFTEELKYHRGAVFAVMYFTAAFYMVLAFVLLIRYRKVFSRIRFFSFMTLIPATIAAVAYQYFYPALVLELFACALSFMFISMMAQRPEERIDMDTGLQNSGAFISDMKRNYRNNKQFHLILIAMTNYKSLERMLIYEQLRGINLHIAQDCSKLATDSLMNIELYHLGEGNYALSIENHFQQNIDEFTDNLRFNLNDDHQIADEKIRIEANVCQLRCPKDLVDFNSVLLFSRQFTSQAILMEETLRLNKKGSSAIKGGNDTDETQDYNFELEISIDQLLRDALDNNQLEVYYQPIFRIGDKKIRSAEALLRLKTEQYGVITADTLIQSAERTGLMERVGDYVLKEVADFISGKDFLKLEMEYISVNVSVQQMIHRNFAMKILDLLDQYYITPQYLRFEIGKAENLMAHETFIDNFHILSAAGIEFILDCYGKDEISIDTLVKFDSHLVKLDRSFVANVLKQEYHPVLQHTIGMFHMMQYEIIAVGIESDEMLQVINSMGCDYIQGFYMKRPLRREEFSKIK